MLKRVIAVLAVMIAVSFSLVAFSSPAEAVACRDGYCNNLIHYSPDDGFDEYFWVRCDALRSNGDWYTLYTDIQEGQGGYGQGCADVKAVYVDTNEQIKCRRPSSPDIWNWDWYTEWDATGWHDLGSEYYMNPGKDFTCVNQRD